MRQRGVSSRTSRRKEARLEVPVRLPIRIGPVVHQRAVDEHAFGATINAERIAGPDHHVGVLARFE